MTGNHSLHLGIDLGGTEIKVAALQADGTCRWSGGDVTDATSGREAVLERLTNLIAVAVKDVGSGRVRGIGIAVPGVLNMAAGTIELLTNFTEEWNGFEFVREMQARAGLPVVMVNDVRAATLAEQMWGAGQEYSDFICVAVGTGVGGGLVLSNRLYLGSRGAAGEIGHITVEPNGHRCNCGNLGCLETVAAAPALARVAQERIEKGDSALAELAGSDRPTPRQLAAAAERGSVAARLIFQSAGVAMGRAVAGLVCALNPQAVIVGGGVAKAGDFLLDPMRQEISRRTPVFTQERGGIAVLASPLGGRAGAMGAAAWSMLGGTP